MPLFSATFSSRCIINDPALQKIHFSSFVMAHHQQAFFEVFHHSSLVLPPHMWYHSLYKLFCIILDCFFNTVTLEGSSHLRNYMWSGKKKKKNFQKVRCLYCYLTQVEPVCTVQIWFHFFFFFSITKRHFVTLSRTKFVFSWGVIDIIYFGCPDQVFWSQSDSKPFDFEYLILLWHIKKKKKTQ